MNYRSLSAMVLGLLLCLQTYEVQATRRKPRDARGANIPDFREQTAAMMAAIKAAEDAQKTKKDLWAEAAGRRTGSKRK